MNNKVTIEELAKEIATALARKKDWWKKEGYDNKRREGLARDLNIHGWELDGVPSVLGHIYSLIESGKIITRSTANDLKQNSMSQIAANTANWYVTEVDAEVIRRELLPTLEDSPISESKAINPVLPKARTKGLEQQKLILRTIKRLGYDPLRLPKEESGHSGVKSLVREELDGKEPFEARTAFNNAWQELLNHDEIIWI